MRYSFFYIRGLNGLDTEIKELSLIAPYFAKGQIESVWDLYFRLNDNIIAKGSYLYVRYKKILMEAESLVLSELNFQYSDYRDRLLLNYAIGFIKNTIKEALRKNKK